MKRHKDSENVPLADQSDEILENVFSDLLSAIAEEEKESIAHETEAFDNYVQRVRSKSHLDFPLFQNRFTKGYQVLLEELKKEQRQEPNR